MIGRALYAARTRAQDAAVKRLLLAAALAFACKDDPPKPTAAPPEPPAIPAAPTPTADPAAVAASATIAAPAAEGSCAAWAGLPRCRMDDRVLASAATPRLQNEALSRTSAQNRARVELAGGVGALRGSEAVRVELCGDKVWALMAAPATEIGGSDALPECDPRAFEGLRPIPE